MSATPSGKKAKSTKTGADNAGLSESSDAGKGQERHTQRAKIEAREATILAAATEVFAESGVDGSRMAEIARRADVAEGTLYLYYRNKQDLLAGVVGRFWQQLTEGAESSLDPEAPATRQLRQLAHYHLQALLDQFEVVALTYRARQRHGQPEFQLAQIRDYVRVFDKVVQRGIDRGELTANLPLWQSRDVFFGTLEYSARTLHLHHRGFDTSVVENLMALFRQYIQPGREKSANPGTDASNRSAKARDQASPYDTTSTSNLEVRLARIESQLGELLARHPTD